MGKPSYRGDGKGTWKMEKKTTASWEETRLMGIGTGAPHYTCKGQPAL